MRAHETTRLRVKARLPGNPTFKRVPLFCAIVGVLSKTDHVCSFLGSNIPKDVERAAMTQFCFEGVYEGT